MFRDIYIPASRYWRRKLNPRIQARSQAFDTFIRAIQCRQRRQYVTEATECTV